MTNLTATQQAAAATQTNSLMRRAIAQQHGDGTWTARVTTHRGYRIGHGATRELALASLMKKVASAARWHAAK